MWQNKNTKIYRRVQSCVGVWKLIHGKPYRLNHPHNPYLGIFFKPMYVLYFSHYFVSTFINRTSRNCYNTPRNVFSFNFIASYFVKNLSAKSRLISATHAVGPPQHIFLAMQPSHRGCSPPKTFLISRTLSSTEGDKSSGTHPDRVYAILGYRRLQQ